MKTERTTGEFTVFRVRHVEQCTLVEHAVVKDRDLYSWEPITTYSSSVLDAKGLKKVLFRCSSCGSFNSIEADASGYASCSDCGENSFEAKICIKQIKNKPAEEPESFTCTICKQKVKVTGIQSASCFTCLATYTRKAGEWDTIGATVHCRCGHLFLVHRSSNLQCNRCGRHVHLDVKRAMWVIDRDVPRETPPTSTPPPGKPPVPADSSEEWDAEAKKRGYIGAFILLGFAWFFVGIQSVFDALMYAATGFFIGSSHYVLRQNKHLIPVALVLGIICLVAGFLLFGVYGLWFFLFYVSLGAFIACFIYGKQKR